MISWKRKVVNGFKQRLPTLLPGNRLALLGICLFGLGLAFGPFWPTALPQEPLPDFVAFINPNRADVVTLEYLPGIGPVLARRIIDARTEGGPFLTWQELQRVKGIGSKLVEKLHFWLTFDE